MVKPKYTPIILSDEEVMKIADTILNSKNYMPTKLGQFLKIRDAYAWRILNALGLRPKELLHLKWSDIKFDERKIILDPYWNKQRIDIPAVITKPALKLLLEYKNLLSQYSIVIDYLFPSASTWQPLSSNNFARRLLSAVKEAGMAKVIYYTDGGQPKYNIKPYTARHTFCTQVFKKTHDTTCVKSLARHLKLESAQYYIHLVHEDKISISDKVWQ